MRNTQEIIDYCGLCGEKKTLKNSHIIPKFVFRWLKESGGKFIRKADTPNKREEDGVTEYMLCNDCEQLFCKFEDKFARDIFYPYSNNNKKDIDYDSDLLRFCISVLYRVILSQIDELKTFNQKYYNNLQETLNEWNKYLQNKDCCDVSQRVHIFLTSDQLDKPFLKIKRFLNYYTRGVDASIVTGQSTCIAYAKMGRILLIANIKGFNDTEMENTLINSTGGKIRASKMKLNYQINQFLINRVIELNISYDTVSEKQRDKAIKYTDEYIRENPNSDISDIISKE